MGFFVAKNLFAKICIIFVVAYLFVGADTTSLVNEKGQEDDEDSGELYLSKIQNDYQTGLVTMVDFFSSLNSSLQAIEGKLNFPRKDEISEIIRSSINTSLEPLREKMLLIEKKIDRINRMVAGDAPVLVSRHKVTSSTGCGGLLEVSEKSTSTIRYPNGGSYTDNERCIWPVVPKINFESYRIKLESVSWESGHDGVIIYYWSSSMELQSLKITEFGSWISIPAPLVIITFCSDASAVGSGFHASIVGVGSFSDSATYRPFWLNNPKGTFTYPEHLEMFGSNEMVPIVVQPKNGQSLEVSVKDTNIGTDVVSVYNLRCQHCDSGPNYAFIGSGSGNNPGGIGELTSNSTYPRLVIFKRNVGLEFTLSFK